MKILKIYIAAFAGLKDYTLDLQEGFNIIHGENGQGKTTVMAFLKMMFYGGKGGKTLAKSPRQKYLPWSGEPAGGRVYFEQNGHRYCLEREFRKSDSTDRVTLRDTDLGTEETVAPDLGKKIFGLSEGAFERSVFIGQTGFPETDEAANGELNARLSNLNTTGEENVSFQQIQKRLTDAAHALTTKQKVGAYDKGLARLEELKADLMKADESAKRCNALQDEMNLLKTKLLTAEKERKALKELTDRENDIRGAERLEEYLKTKQELDAFNDGLRLQDGTAADTVFLNTVNFCLTKYEHEDRAFAEQQSEMETLEKDIAYRESAKTDLTPEVLANMTAERDKCIAEKTDAEQRLSAAEQDFDQAQKILEENQNAPKKCHPLLLGIGLVLLAGSAALFFLTPFLFAATIGGLGLLSTILAFCIRPANRTLRTKAEKSVADARETVTDAKTAVADAGEKLNRAESALNRAESALQTDEALINQRKTDLAERKLKLAEIAVKRDATFAELQTAFRKFRNAETIESIRALLPELKEKIEQQKEIKLKLNYLCGDLGNISYETAAEKLKAIRENESDPNIDFEKVKQRLEILTEQIRELVQRYTATESELKNELKYAVAPDTVEREIRETEERVAKQKQYLDALMLAQTVLENSFAEVRRGFGSALENRTQAIFSALTDGKFKNVHISKSLELDAESKDTFGTHSVSYFSSGTVDQAYLSLRLAITESMSENERLPILLDDVLCQYDDKRCEYALQFLKEYAVNNQIILFTCHRSICEQAEKQGISVRSLR